MLTALRSEGTDSASPVDRALCRLARAAYEVYRLDRDRGELRQALLDACRAYAGLDAEPDKPEAPAPAPSERGCLAEMRALARPVEDARTRPRPRIC